MEFRDRNTPLTLEQSEMRKMVHKQITYDPGSLDMSAWEFIPQAWVSELARMTDVACGTTRCVAGWAQYLARGYVDRGTVMQDAVRALGLTWAEYRGGDPATVGLFHTYNADAVKRMAWLATVEPG